VPDRVYLLRRKLPKHKPLTALRKRASRDPDWCVRMGRLHRILLAVGIATFAVGAGRFMYPMLGAGCAGPRIACDTPVIDVGNVAVGTTIQKRFRICNSGWQTLKLFEVSPTCPCTTCEIGVNAISPGESTSLEVTIDTSRFAAKEFSSTVYVRSSDPGKPQVALGVIGTAVPGFRGDD
jgi:hypothetical protein